ncbi:MULTISPECIES: metal ABC transporter solute-binding protein, Zn/Mn family [Microbacterium]|uniref:metal ABC transporter solute-binding protein, Zn/Mn family n=1 Tax=Microbacterium TaxID=33882 RepID=UPI00217D64A6|nr:MULTISPECIES: zinc ABC transporter substrate-binding protein [Microbacterium]UWF77478.1 zinc ABC transporter substrate-binding protein [Microbacterium neungamense]WCM55641.1 zinc ABC transporter substrate-binding protein [Microbacterium sp. EF45047]
MKKSAVTLAAASVAALALTGCSTSANGAAGGDAVQVVASTNVYGDLVAQIGGDRVEVTSLIASATKDPHSYEPTARDRLTVQGADLLIENGGGYDGFLEELREGSDAPVITAAEFSHDFPGAEEHGTDEHDHEEHSDGEHADAPAETDAAETDAPADTEAPAEDEHADEHGHEGHDHIEGFNEHVWFDVHTMVHVVEQIAADLTELDPEGEKEFAANAEELVAELEDLEAELDTLHGQHEGTPVFLTEPLAGYLAASAGLENATPEGFDEAVEEGSDVAPATLLDALAVVEGGQVAAVLTNAQTGGAETERVEAAAEKAGIPVVAFTELLEPEQSYAEWMRAAIDDLAAALSQ